MVEMEQKLKISKEKEWKVYQILKGPLVKSLGLSETKLREDFETYWEERIKANTFLEILD
jgi:hypothetical protein